MGRFVTTDIGAACRRHSTKKSKNFFLAVPQKKVSTWMRGKVSAEEINHFVASEIGIPYPELWQLFVNDCTTMSVSPQVLTKISELREKYIVVLMTGNMDSFTRFTVPALDLEKYFDYISNSYYEERNKTDNNGQLLLDYALKFDVPFSECSMIDDSEEVCSLVKKHGGTAYRVTPEADVVQHLSAIERTL